MNRVRASVTEVANRYFGHSNNEAQVLGSLLLASGGLISAIGLGVEVANPEPLTKLVVAAGVGATAIGGLVRATNRSNL